MDWDKIERLNEEIAIRIQWTHGGSDHWGLEYE